MAEAVSVDRRILITGGTGFLGRAIIRRLANQPGTVSLIQRQQPGFGPRVAGGIYQADLAEIDADHPAFTSVNIVVHAAVDYGSAHRSVEMVRRVIAACRHRGVGRIVFISSHNAGFQQPGEYSRGKIDGERLVRKSGLQWVILRPTLLYGSAGGPFLSSLIRLARTTRIIPVLGSGDALIQPAHRRDVAAIVGAAIEEGLDGRVIATGGADSISLRTLATAIRESIGPSLAIPLALPLLRLAATVHSPLRDKIRELDEDKTLTVEELGFVTQILGRRPQSLATDLPSIVASI